LKTVSGVNTICLILVAVFLLWMMIQFPEAGLDRTNKNFQQKIEQTQSIDEIKAVANEFSQRVSYVQGQVRLIGGATILSDFTLIVLLAANFFVMRRIKKGLQQNDARN